MKIRPQYLTGLTRWEAVALAVCGVALLGLIALAALPHFARAKDGRSYSPTNCRNNLKQIGIASQIWANDFGGEYPFASTNEAGSRAWVQSPEVFRHFQVMSNELVTPRILACRADKSRSVALDFIQLSNTNLSYFVGLDARLDNPQSILSGDRNIIGGTLSNGFLRALNANSEAGWTKEIHQNSGNIGLGDGSVQQVTPMNLREQIALAATNRPFIRLAVP